MNHDPTDLAAQETKRAESESERHTREAQEKSDFRWLMRQPPFRRFVWRLMGVAGVFRSTFNKDASVAAFLEGRRDMGLFVQSEIQELAPEGYELMLQERRQKTEMKTHG